MSNQGSASPADFATVLPGKVPLPLLGLGVWLIPAGPPTEQAVGWALEAGYRHVDTAQAYENEESVGAGLRASGVPRHEVFVATKFRPRAEDPEAEAERSLERLGIDRLDLYLVHWPEGGPTWAWPGMVRALRRGLTRAIGVSNFSVDEIEKVLAVTDEPPAVNQIHLNPFAYRRKLVDACLRHGIAVEAYSPLTHGRDLDHPVIRGIAERLGHTPAQVLLRWGIEHGFAVIPKSARRERIVENAAIFDFRLSPEDLAALDALDRTHGTGRAVEQPWW